MPNDENILYDDNTDQNFTTPCCLGQIYDTSLFIREPKLVKCPKCGQDVKIWAIQVAQNRAYCCIPNSEDDPFVDEDGNEIDDEDVDWPHNIILD